jgi:DNA modification methylase
MKQEIEQIKTADLVPYARNAKKHDEAQVAKIAGSIREFGFNNPVLIDADNGIIAGHGRVMAAQKLGLAAVPCLRLSHLSETQKRAYILADNRLAEIGGGWDAEMLKLELADLGDLDVDLDGIGFGADDLQDLELSEEPETSEADAEPQIDKAEELRAKWGVEPGQLWELGDHRLLCGDSTKKEDVERVMGGTTPEIIFTDPPYSSGGFQESGKTSGSIGARGQKKIENDNLSTRGYIALMDRVLGHLREAHSAFIFCDWKMWVHNQDIAESKGYRVRNMLVWDKQQMGMGMPFRNQHELCLFGSKLAGKIGNGNTPNVLQCKRDREADHATPKPVELIVRMLAQVEGCEVAEPFSGGGSTLIACEQLGRKCRAIEISPAYVAVALQRWADATGKTPKLVA